MSAIPLSRIEGKYEILEKLREGGMGAIYKVRHRLLDEVRVVKLMRPQFTQDEALKTRFSREARLAIKLRHPNIAQLYDFTVDEEDDTAFIVMEYIEGMNLEDVVAANGPLPLGIALEIAQQALRAIGYLHSRGFVHRDISPDNLMLTEDADGQPLVKLIDLGIAKGQEGGGESHLTQTGTFLGKVRYASPEQFGVEGVASTDARSDLYSFGIVLYELLTARYPIQGRDPTSLIAGHLFRPPLDFSETDPNGQVPEGVRGLVLQALAKSPSDRFSSAQELSRALGAFRVPSDLPEVAVRRLLVRAPKVVDFPEPPGTTQDRLDQQFGLVATPTPSLLELAKPAPAMAAGDVGEPSKVRRCIATIALQLDRGDLLAADAELRWAEETFGEQSDLRTLRDRLQGLRAREVEQRIHDLLAEARRLLDEDPEQALDRALQARSLDSANPEVSALLARAESALQGRDEERRRAEEAETIAEIEAALERSDVRGAETLLYAAEARLGAHGALATLFARLAERRREEVQARRREEEALRVVAEIESLLVSGDLEESTRRLQQAHSAFGEREAWAVLESRLEELRRQAARDEEIASLLARAQNLATGEDFEGALQELRRAECLVPDGAAVRLRIQVTEEAAGRKAQEKQRTAEIAAVSQQIRQLLDRGEMERAAELLDEAVARFGTVSSLLESVERLDALRRARADEEARRAAERQRELERTIVQAPAPQPRTRPAVPLPEMGTEALTSSAPPAGLSRGESAAAAAPREERPRAPRAGRKTGAVVVAVAAGVLVVVVVLFFGLGRKTVEEVPASAPVAQVEDGELALPAVAVGVLILDALPWGEVVEILDADGRAQPLGAQKHTPLALTLPAGRYTLRLRNPDIPATAVVEVEILPGAQVRSLVELGGVNEEQFFRGLGW